jgi:hypothetical protein
MRTLISLQNFYAVESINLPFFLSNLE